MMGYDKWLEKMDSIPEEVSKISEFQNFLKNAALT